MDNPVLLSESFERAAYAHRSAIENFDTSGFEAAATQFTRSVDKLQAILGMQAENDQRKVLGQSMAYVEDDFARA